MITVLKVATLPLQRHFDVIKCDVILSIRRHAGGGDKDVHCQATRRALSAGGWCCAGVPDSWRWDHPLHVSSSKLRMFFHFSDCDLLNYRVWVTKNVLVLLLVCSYWMCNDYCLTTGMCFYARLNWRSLFWCRGQRVKLGSHLSWCSMAGFHDERAGLTG